MKEIYLVRHGESEGNVREVHQSPNTPLTEAGLLQAQTLAQRFSRIPGPFLIIASPYLRAMQTARAIAAQNHFSIETDELLIEKKVASQLVGQSHHGPLSLEIKAMINAHALEQNGQWQYADEESAWQFTQRIQRVLQKLSQRPEKKLIIVSHALTLKMLITQILDPTGNLEHWYAMYNNFNLDNTGLSRARYDERIGAWKIICLNDSSHLG